MKKLKRLIALCSLACVMVGTAACSVVSDVTSKVNGILHDTLNKHEFTTEWESDANNHWHACSGESCLEVANKAAHTWNDGEVTKEPTETAEGVMTYECTVCGYEKEEAIEKLEPTHTHTWATEWSMDENYHWYASTCGHEDKDKAAHEFDEGYVEKAATETEEGVMVYTCIDCGYEVEEAIPTIDHKHVYSEEWTSNETSHWHAATCGHTNVKDKDNHAFGEGVITREPTEELEGITAYTCTVCDYVKEEPIDKLPHTHKFATEWSKDADYHWYASTCGHDDTITKIPHTWNDGVETTKPTETADGVKTFTCEICGQTKEVAIPALNHTHTYGTEYGYDANDHWFKPTCGHEDAIEKVAHEFNEYGDCVCGYHEVCETCGKCVSAECTECEEKCLFLDMNKVITFAPNKTLGAPEGPDGLAPGKDGAYTTLDTDAENEEDIKAEYVVLDNGAYATKVTLPKGAAAHSGVSFLNNKNIATAGKAGYNCGIPQYKNVTKTVRMYFTNNGTSEITFKYSAIDYYYDKGVVEVTLAAGESKTVLLNVTYDYDTYGLNHQIVFPEGAAVGSSLTIWGEFVADNLTGISVSVPATKLNFGLGETFSAEGLVLAATGVKNSNGSDTYQRVYISQNYKTDLDGYVFTEADVEAGKKTVTVTFAGYTATYEVAVYDHVHELEYVEGEDAVTCEKDGVMAHYSCTVEGCDMCFADQYGNELIDPMISCHTEKTTLPGDTLVCANCGETYGVKSMENWILYTPAARLYSANDMISLAYSEVNGVAGTKVTFAAGANDTNASFKFYCENDLAVDNGVPYQHKLPNVGTNMPSGSTRSLVVYFQNYGTEDVTLTFRNDGNSAVSITITVPAGGTAIGETTMYKAGGYNYFDLYLNNTEALKSNVTIGMYGYIEILEGEIDTPTIKQATTTYYVGDTFSTEDLVLQAYLPNSYGRDIYVWTGYTTNFDGYVFTEEDAGKTYTVFATFAGKTVTYEITVTAASTESAE